MSRKQDPRQSIEDTWQQIQEYDAEHHPDKLAPDAPRFIDYAWKKFDVKKVVEVLLSDMQTYKALKPILFSGLCCRVVCPNRESLRQHGMLLVGIEHLRAAEELGRKLFVGRDIPNHDLLGEIIGRMRLLGPHFYSDFYYPIGGLAQIIRSTTPGTYARSLAHHSREARNVAMIMQLIDYHAKNLRNKKIYYPISETKAYKLVRVILKGRREIGVSVELSEERWKKLNSQAALIYAASTIFVSDDESLLDLICSGRAIYDDHSDFLGMWLGRARYATETLLSTLKKPEIGQANARLLPLLPPVPTPQPSFTAAEKARIEGEFDMARILGSRQQTERHSGTPR